MKSGAEVRQRELVSAVVPVFNEEFGITTFWSRLASSLKNEREFDFEIVFLDDVSTDDSLGIVEEIALQSLSQTRNRPLYIVADEIGSTRGKGSKGKR